MQTYIYKSSRKQGAYIYLINKDDFKILPESLSQILGRLEFVMSLSVQSDTRLAQADSRLVIQELEDKGFYLQYHDPKILP